uniref:Uncharacterized protein n=1 Tax=Magallana gigas TaxID=29159 RepID=A0A8W8M6J9_MAGGI
MREGTGVSLQDRETKNPTTISNEQEKQMRLKYDRLPNKTQKQKHQKETGMKGTYALIKLPYHNRLHQMQPDGIHTIADFISHVANMMESISGVLAWYDTSLFTSFPVRRFRTFSTDM